MSQTVQPTVRPPDIGQSPGSALRQVIEKSKLKMQTSGLYERVTPWAGNASEIDQTVKEIATRARVVSETVDAAPELVQKKVTGQMKALGEQITALLNDEVAVEDRAKKLLKVKSALDSVGKLEVAVGKAVVAHAAERELQRQIEADKTLLADFLIRKEVWKTKTVDATAGKAALAALKRLEDLAAPVLRDTGVLAVKDRAAFGPAGLDQVGMVFDIAETATETAIEAAKAVAAERDRLAKLLTKAIPANDDTGVADATKADGTKVLAKRRDIDAEINARVDTVDQLAGIEDEIETLSKAVQVLRDLLDERRRLAGLLDAEVAPSSGPGDIAPGAAIEDVTAAVRKRNAIASEIGTLKAGGSVKIIGDIKTLTELVATVRAVVARRAALTDLLEAALAAGAAPADIVEGATGGDVAGVVAERKAILTEIGTPGGTLGDLAKVEVRITGLTSMITQLGRGLSAARKELLKLKAERGKIDELAAGLSTTNPPGCSAGQAGALDAGRTAVAVALAAPLTKENNAAAAGEVKKQAALHEAASDMVKEARKENEKQVQPSLQQLKKIEEEFVRLKIDSASSLSAQKAYGVEIRDAQARADWTKALQLAKELDTALEEPARIVADLTAFRDDGKLVAATYDAILEKLVTAGAFTLQAAKDELKRVYGLQCEVKRDDWLTLLGVAGSNVKVGSPDGPHYTTFNSGVLSGAAFASVDQDLDVLCTRLFKTGITSAFQLHATVVVGTDRHHKYWDGTYSWPFKDLSASEKVKAQGARLDEWHGKLVSDMRKKVQEAIAAHGRVGTNKTGPVYV